MTLSILEICQDAALELSLVSPTAVAGDVNDDTAEKLLRHLTRCCKQVAGRHDWQILRREHTFTTVDDPEQTGALASDYLRMIPLSMWNRTRNRKVQGPITPAEWQAYQAMVTSGIFDQFMIRGSSVMFTPTPSPGQTIAYEYITNAIGTDSTGVTQKTRFSADTDIPYFDDELLTLGLVWRYRKSEGLDYAEEFRDFELRMAELLKMDGGRRVLDMNNERLERVPNVIANTIEDLTSL